MLHELDSICKPTAKEKFCSCLVQTIIGTKAKFGLKIFHQLSEFNDTLKILTEELHKPVVKIINIVLLEIINIKRK